MKPWVNSTMPKPFLDFMFSSVTAYAVDRYNTLFFKLGDYPRIL